MSTPAQPGPTPIPRRPRAVAAGGTVTDLVTKRRAAATWLAEQGFAIVHIPQGRKDPDGGKAWQKRAVTDPGMAGNLIKTERDQFGALPRKGSRLLVIDQDVPGKLEELGLEIPKTLRVRTSVKDPATGWRGQHVYLRLAAGVGEGEVPRSWDGGEVRLAGSGQVVGPWSTHPSGVVYEPVDDVRAIGVATRELIDALRASKSRKRGREDTATGPDDPGWYIGRGRHEHLVEKGRWLRGHGLTGDRLLDELVRLDRDRHRPPIADLRGRGVEEIEGIVKWVMDEIGDDEPGVRLVTTSTRAPQPEPARIDAADLLALDLAPLRWIVPDILPEGTTILASPPKVGKSCLVYQVVAEVALGGDLLGRRVTPGSALYLALEDGKRRGQDRLRAALADRTMPRGRLDVQWGSRRIGAGLEDDLAAWLDSHADAAVVAIDTLGRVRPATTGRRNQYELDVEDLGRLQSLFRDLPISLLIVHHARKDNGGDDFLQAVSGTYGLTGSVDTIAALRRKRLETFGSLVVTGRDVPDAEFPVRFDGTLWHTAPASLPAASFERMEVYRVIEAEGPIFPKAIGDRLGLERSSVQHMVDKLVGSGAVARTTSGYTAAEGARAGNPDHSSHSPSDHSDRGDRSTRARATLPHTCHGCQSPIDDLADGFFDGATATFWHQAHWHEHEQATA